MNKIINKFLLTGDKFMPELHLKQHGFTYKDLAERTISDKILKDRAFKIGRNHGCGGYQRALASMFYKVFEKKTGSGISVNGQLAEELHKPVIKKIQKKKRICEI